MSDWAPINAKQTPIGGGSNDASSSELPPRQAVSTHALSSGCSTAMDTDGSASWKPWAPPSYGHIDDKKSDVSSPFHPRANPSYQKPGPPASNTDNLANSSVPAVLTRDPMRQPLHGPDLPPADTENTDRHQKSVAKRPKNKLPGINLSADPASDAYDLNTRHLVRLLSPQADGLINRLVAGHKTPLWRNGASTVSIINEHAWNLVMETATEELKGPVCRLSTIGRALHDMYTESEIDDKVKGSNATLCCIKDLLNRIEQTLLLFADIPHIELALAGLRLKQLGLGSADPNRAHHQNRQGSTYPSAQICPDPPPPGMGLKRVECEADEGFVQSRSGPVPPGYLPFF